MSDRSKNDRLKKILLSTFWGPFYGYLIAGGVSIAAKLLGMGLYSYFEMISILLLAELSVGLAFLFVYLKKQFTPQLNRLVTYVFQASNLVFFCLWVYLLNDLRFISIIILTLSLIYLINYATFLQSLMISLTSVLSYLGVVLYAIHYARQQGNLLLDLFTGFCFIPTAILISYMAGIFKKQREKIRLAKRDAEQSRDQLWGEMELAKRIQTVLLPVKPRIDNYEISAYMKPADEVGGDYYNIVNLAGYDWIVIGDVSGHGVSAGLIMMMVNASMKSVLFANPNVEPSDLLTSINNSLTEDIKRIDPEKYMTMTVLACHKEGEFVFSGLHQDIMVYRAEQDKVELISTNGLWIGILEDLGRVNNDESFSLAINDVMILYTDGITEAIDSEGSMFSDEGLKETFHNLGRESTDDIKAGILDKMAGYKARDDVTMVIIRRIT